MADTSRIRGSISEHLCRLLDSREAPKTICPSEVARAIPSGELHDIGASSWRDLMPEIRHLAAEMRFRGDLEVLQKGNVLEGDLGEGLEHVTGPIRLRKTKQQ
jgi:hypothetical protein